MDQARWWSSVRRAGLALVWAMAAGGAAAAPSVVDFRGEHASAEVRRLAALALGERDAQGKPFAVVDKKAARLFVFDARGQLVGASAALLGSAAGDVSAPGVAKRAASYIPPDQRTTPAGRFDSEPGHNLDGEAIVWVAYDAAVAIHRLRPAPKAERRPQRLASATPDDNRISLGCIVVGERFYDMVVAPTLGVRRGVVYVLPETGELSATFGFGAADL
jgi:hypothetical protein